MNRRLVSVLRAHAAGTCTPETIARARWLLREDLDSRIRKRAKSLPRRRNDEATKAAAREKHDRLMAEVMARPGPACELGEHETDQGVDPHHLEGGPARLKRERLGNVIRACRACHDAFHSNAAAFVPTVKAWCSRFSYPPPNRKEYRGP